MSEPGDESSGTASQLARYSGHGLTLGLAVALFAWLGSRLDERLGTSPLFIAVGAALGFGGGLYRMLRELGGSGESAGGSGS